MMLGTDFALFRDRHEAGKLLAKQLTHYEGAKDAIVIALPRGGVVVGYDVSLALTLPLDVLITRKLGTPSNPELAMGAIAETGYVHMNSDVMREYHITHAQLEKEIEAQKSEMHRRIQRYREGRALASLKSKTVILVDDGIATGATFLASLGAITKEKTTRVVAAVPVAPPRMVEQLKGLVDEVVVLYSPEWFFGVGQFYEQFPQVEDEEVVASLENVRTFLSKAKKVQRKEVP
jgi:putative phosphoribosyl transferase